MVIPRYLPVYMITLTMWSRLHEPCVNIYSLCKCVFVHFCMRALNACVCNVDSRIGEKETPAHFKHAD